MDEVNAQRGVRFGVFEADFRAGELRKQGFKVKLQEQPFQILQILLEHPRELVSREELRRQIWSDNTFVDFDHGLYNSIKKLREVLGDSADSPHYIETISRRGYRFIGTVNGIADAAAAVPEGSAVRHINTDSRPRQRKLVIGVLTVSVVVIAAVITLNFVRLRERLLAGSSSPHIGSLAVLPLENLSGDASQDYFADAMTEELITELSRISALRVVSRTSVMRYKKSDKRLPQIARELNADAIVEGSVIRAGDRVRITAQLIYAPKDTNVWARTYERDLRDVLELQSEVAGAITNEIQVRVTPQEAARLAAGKPVNPKALDAYFAGRYHLSKKIIYLDFIKGKEKSDQEEYVKATQCFQQAIKEDPTYAPGYLGLADARLSAYVPTTATVTEAKAAIMKALELDSTLSDAHLALAMFRMQYEWNWVGAEREFQRMLELNPSSAIGHDQYGYYLDAMARFDEASKQHLRAQELDPGNDHLSGELYFKKQWDLERDLRIHLGGANGWDNGPWYRAVEYERMGKHKEAIAEWQRVAKEFNFNDAADALAHGYAKSGYKGGFQEMTQTLEKYSRRQYILPDFMAHFYGELDDRDRAFAWLEKAYGERVASMQFLKVDPLWGENLRRDRRFADLERRVGLAQ
jgi:TolB-like protein/DNA-binding winged helix-turn-helix (wHTH) protein